MRPRTLLVTALAAGIASGFIPGANAGVPVIDAKAIRELSTIVVATARQLVELKKIMATTGLLLLAVGEEDETKEFKKDLRSELATGARNVGALSAGAGTAREGARREIFAELTGAVGGTGTAGTTDAGEHVRRTFETHDDAKTWLREHYFVIAEKDDAIGDGSVSGGENFLSAAAHAKRRAIADRRQMLAQAAAVDAWALGALAQNGLVKYLEHEEKIAEQLEAATSLRAELAVGIAATVDAVQAEVASVVLSAARLELEALTILSQSPAILTPRYACALFGEDSGSCVP